MYDTIIIGAGPAGLTAAIYLTRANKSVLVLEGNTYGGAIVNTLKIENYPACPYVSGFDFANSIYKQAKDLGAKIVFEKAVSIRTGKIKTVITNKSKYIASSIIIATGTKKRKLSLDNEERFIGKGISYCATCDGNFYKGKTVAVVGGGNTAIEDTLYLSSVAKKVYLIHRRDNFKAAAKNVDLLMKRSNVEFVLNGSIINLNGHKHLESIDIKLNNTVKTIIIDGLFAAIGQNPCTENLQGIVKLNSDGYIKAKEAYTNRKGIFVAGDVREKNYRQLVTATSDGAIAAMTCINFLNMNKKG